MKITSAMVADALSRSEPVRRLNGRDVYHIMLGAAQRDLVLAALRSTQMEIEVDAGENDRVCGGKGGDPPLQDRQQIP